MGAVFAYLPVLPCRVLFSLSLLYLLEGVERHTGYAKTDGV